MTNQNSNPAEEEDIFDKIVGLDGDGKKDGDKEGSQSSDDSDNSDDSKDGSGSSDEGSEKDEPDFEQKYKSSVKEVQKKYIPMEQAVKQLEEKTGKPIGDLVKEVEKLDLKEETQEDNSEEGEEGEISPEEIKKIKQSVQKLEQSFETKTKQEVKKKVESFRERHNLDEGFYNEKIVPVLEGVKHMENPKTGEAYSLEDGLELAFQFVKKTDPELLKNSNVSDYEKSASNSPRGTSSQEAPESDDGYTPDQMDIARKMGVDLGKED